MSPKAWDASRSATGSIPVFSLLFTSLYNIFTPYIQSGEEKIALTSVKQGGSADFFSFNKISSNFFCYI